MDLIMAAWAGRPGHARLSLQSLRADRVQEAGRPLRDARRGAGSNCSAPSASWTSTPSSRQAVRCGVESYSIKKLEQYYGFTRGVALKSASQPLMAVELALEAQTPDAITDEIRDSGAGLQRGRLPIDRRRCATGWSASAPRLSSAGETIATAGSAKERRRREGRVRAAAAKVERPSRAAAGRRAARAPAIPIMRSTRGGCWRI